MLSLWRIPFNKHGDLYRQQPSPQFLFHHPIGSRTLTLDNGTENAGHEELTSKLGTTCYFADPYAAWQRGSNEQINGLVRRYLPKGTDFSKIDKDQIKRIERLINNRPRKCLGFKTPLEVARSIVALHT